MKLYDLFISSFPNANKHYLVRYLAFCDHYYIHANVGIVEQHHILPKKLFPSYKSFRKHPWNRVALSPRQHYIAHLLLHKAIPHNEDAFYSIWCMKHQNGVKVTSKHYDYLKRTYRPIAQRNAKGMIVVKDAFGNTSKVRTDDPRYQLGELVAFSKGLSLPKSNVDNYKKPKTKKHKDNISKYRSIRHVISGKVIRVHYTDPRTTSCEYAHITKGLKRTEESRRKTSLSNIKPQAQTCCMQCRSKVSVNNLDRHFNSKKCLSTSLRINL